VDTARCNTCHLQLGVTPTFHAGQRNDGPTCSFCHNPNRTSSAWSANAKDFLHAIHGGRIRTVPFNWHAVSDEENFGDVEFPSNINNCEACHAANTYDFTLASTVNALPNMLPSTVATGKFNRDPVTNPTGWFAIAPADYVTANNVLDYGVGFAVNVSTNVITPAANTTLIKSPITAACSACHDAKPSIAHMEAMGGAFYRSRAEVFAK
jgi:OmcA/MtrC family decaheme c-type cytochrome